MDFDSDMVDFDLDTVNCSSLTASAAIYDPGRKVLLSTEYLLGLHLSIEQRGHFGFFKYKEFETDKPCKFLVLFVSRKLLTWIETWVKEDSAVCRGWFQMLLVQREALDGRKEGALGFAGLASSLPWWFDTLGALQE